MLSPKVIIIGAGAAGIAATSKLVASNLCNVTVLEAESRIGGRILTSHFGDGIVDLGAQWVHGEVNNVAHALGSSAGLLDDNSNDILEGKYVLSDGTVVNEDDAEEFLSACFEVLEDKEKQANFIGSVGDYFLDSMKEKLKEKEFTLDGNTANSFIYWLQQFQNSLDGSDSWFHTSAVGHNQYQECEGNTITRWKKGGYNSIFNLLLGNNRAKVEEKILFNKTVKTISWDQHPLEVVCTDGQKYTADHVLSTVPLGVLKENVSKMFNPSLPLKKITAIQKLGLGTVDKIFLKFPHRWWPDDCAGFSLLWRQSDVPPESEVNWTREVFGFYGVDDNALVLCGWIVGPAARHMEQCSDDQVKEGCYQLLRRFLGSQYNIPLPDSILRSQWHVNPHFRGSYSFRSVDSETYDAWAVDLATPLPLSGKPVLLFAGEATHSHFYSTVHGAIESGWREADRLISHFSTSSISRLPKASL